MVVAVAWVSFSASIRIGPTQVTISAIRNRMGLPLLARTLLLVDDVLFESRSEVAEFVMVIRRFNGAVRVAELIGPMGSPIEGRSVGQPGVVVRIMREHEHGALRSQWADELRREFGAVECLVGAWVCGCVVGVEVLGTELADDQIFEVGAFRRRGIGELVGTVDDPQVVSGCGPLVEFVEVVDTNCADRSGAEDCSPSKPG